MDDLKKFTRPQQVHKELLASRTPTRSGAGRKFIILLLAIGLAFAIGELAAQDSALVKLASIIWN